MHRNTSVSAYIFRQIITSLLAIALLVIAFAAYLASPFLPHAYGTSVTEDASSHPVCSVVEKTTPSSADAVDNTLVPSCANVSNVM